MPTTPRKPSGRTVTFWLSLDEIDTLDDEAKQRDYSRNAVVRDLIRSLRPT